MVVESRVFTTIRCNSFPRMEENGVVYIDNQSGGVWVEETYCGIVSVSYPIQVADIGPDAGGRVQ